MIPAYTTASARSFILFVQTYVSPVSLLLNFEAWMAIQAAGYEIMGAEFDKLFDRVVLAGQVAPVVKILNDLVIEVNKVINSPDKIKALVQDAIYKIEALLPPVAD